MQLDITARIRKLRQTIRANSARFYKDISLRTQLYKEIENLENEVDHVNIYIQNLFRQYGNNSRILEQHLPVGRRRKKQLEKQITQKERQIGILSRRIDVYLTWVDRLNELELADLSDSQNDLRDFLEIHSIL